MLSKSLFGVTSCDCRYVVDEAAECFELVVGERGFDLAWVEVRVERLECAWENGFVECRLEFPLWRGDVIGLMDLHFLLEILQGILGRLVDMFACRLPASALLWTLILLVAQFLSALVGLDVLGELKGQG